MDDLVYTPDPDLKVHKEGMIKLICSGFQSHEAGLPEWIKNSSDAYSRKNAPEDERVIIAIIQQGKEDVLPSISCLDFAGMTSIEIEKNFRHWADPDAAHGGNTDIAVQGGHGNGGKCYMTQMFDRHAHIHTLKDGRGNHYGVKSGSVKFGYIPNPENGKDFVVKDLNAYLEEALVETGCSLGTAWKVAKVALRATNGFTLVTGIGPKGYKDKFPIKPIIENLQENTQMIQTLEFCKVYVVVNGKLFKRGEPLCLPQIKPIKGEEPRVLPIPEFLVDEKTGEEVSTTDQGKHPQGRLTLNTSNSSMKFRKRGRHTIVYKAQSGYIGSKAVPEFDVISSYLANIYGVCELMSLEPYKKNDRTDLADSPLTRAIYRFISDQIQEYAEVFDDRNKKKYDHEEKNAISAMNEALNKWKNRFLNEVLRGMWGSGNGGTKPPVRNPLPTGSPERMDLNLSYQKAGIGISIKPAIKFFDSEGRKIRPIPFRWVSEDNNVAMVDDERMEIQTFSYGVTDIYAETLDGTIRSNKVKLEVVRIIEISIIPNEIEVSTGSRHKLNAVCQIADGEETSAVYLDWIVTNSNVAGVNASGTVFGLSVGETVVTAGDGKCDAKNPASVKVLAGAGRGSGDNKGRGYPLVLVSGEIDTDPDTGEFRQLSKHDPPVYQDAHDVDRNIWWINSDAPLARLYLDVYGYKAREWRMYHLERYIEVISQIALTHGPEELEMLSVNDWIYHWGDQVAQIQAAASADLTEFISKGDLPV